MEPERLAQTFKALADPNRVRIVAILRENGETCACELLDQLEVTQPTLSYHMRALCSCGLVSARRDGKWMRYSLCPDAAAPAAEFLASQGRA